MPSPEAIVAKAREYLGLPWKHQGRSKTLGVDCVGLIVLTFTELGVAIEDRANYRRRTDGQEILDVCDRYAARVPISDLQAGDVVVFSYNGGPDHAGFVGEHDGRLTLIHAYWSFRKVVEHGLGDEFLARAVAAYRFAEENAA